MSAAVGFEQAVLLNDANDAYPLYGIGQPHPKPPGTIRIWVDGCFDMMHFGHCNVLRQAAALGSELFVGVHSDREILAYKGPVLLREQERYELVRSCRWVTYVVENAPYVTRLADMTLLDIDYVVHGDDISTDLNGQNSYQSIIDAGLFKVVKRTDGISTTEIVRRILAIADWKQLPQAGVTTKDLCALWDTFQFYPTTSRKFVQFYPNRVPANGDRVVYVEGTFDLLHHRDIAFLRAAKALGDYLIVGVHRDEVPRTVEDLTVMNVNERTLSLLACRYVDEVVIGVMKRGKDTHPALFDAMRIDIVAVDSGEESANIEAENPSYHYAKEKGILRVVYPTVASTSGLEAHFTKETIVQRVVQDHQKYLERNLIKDIKDNVTQESKPIQFRNVTEI